MFKLTNQFEPFGNARLVEVVFAWQLFGLLAQLKVFHTNWAFNFFVLMNVNKINVLDFEENWLILPNSSWFILTRGKFMSCCSVAGGGPVFSNWLSNYEKKNTYHQFVY